MRTGITLMLFSIFLFILGLIFGSFISALTYRYPRGISIVKGRSFCPKCKKQIAWFDNIPVVSYLILGGRCRNCKKKISPRYILIELATGLGFLTLQGLTLQGVYSIYILAGQLAVFVILESIFIIDLEHQIIPDDFIFPGLLVSLLATDYLLLATLFSGFLAASLLMLIHLLTRGRGMGLGDVKFAVLGGILVGLKLMPVWLFLSFLTGGVAGFILILGRRAGLKDKIAFGPFLIIGLGLTFLYGNTFLRILGF